MKFNLNLIWMRTSLSSRPASSTYIIKFSIFSVSLTRILLYNVSWMRWWNKCNSIRGKRRSYPSVRRECALSASAIQHVQHALSNVADFWTKWIACMLMLMTAGSFNSSHSGLMKRAHAHILIQREQLANGMSIIGEIEHRKWRELKQRNEKRRTTFCNERWTIENEQYERSLVNASKWMHSQCVQLKIVPKILLQSRNALYNYTNSVRLCSLLEVIYSLDACR